MADQLEEYRRAMQQRYRGAGTGGPRREDARSSGEEERKKREQQLRQDEELAKKLQDSYYGPSDYPQVPPSYAPPGPPPPQNYPPPQYYPPPQHYSGPNSSQNRSSQNLNQAGSGFLPQINDKCCGVNAQTCVLTFAAVLAAGIIVSLVSLI